MASELRLTINFAYEKGNNKIDRQVANLGVDVTGIVVASGVQTIGTSAEALELNDVATGGWLFMRNLDTTNFVEMRPTVNDADLVKLKPGEFACFRVSGDATPNMIADTAAVNVAYVLLSD